MKKTLLRGLLNVLPLVLSIWLFWSLFESLDKVGNFLFGLFHITELFKGAGFLLILTLLFIAGLLFSVSPIAWLYDFIIRQLMRFPFFKTVYSSINDIASLMSSDNKNKGQQTVLVHQANDSYVIGFIMSDDMPEPLANALPEGDWVPVLFPLSYQIAGVTTLVKREDLTLVDWSFEEAMRYNLTAGISTPKGKSDKNTKEETDILSDS
ncbi:DUF502 domain-containing protein [Photobacterium angustum]|uniref:DUF502 domain-containing protein n=1 Tax=Photobacterium angustum TaxID=661 RepID=A0A0D8QHE8_PHOAN|nr:DUF502 domain-containing protein [Photobacterium angustum]KJF94969.1 hypothetical protein UB39_07965 [Photobacterium angustum]KJG01610.1 hypothetical protein UB35_12040 [Photobacterium angustum]KJG06267.1 hypothetical protein UB33_09855 [Photobacterium angustum]KJG23653.1 hypothetical protein UA39_10605 [Photobacterium angustum]KJG30315.1 hypothetical protein UA69_11535 [Photobacterium angustum]